MSERLEALQRRYKSLFNAIIFKSPPHQKRKKSTKVKRPVVYFLCAIKQPSTYSLANHALYVCILNSGS